MVINGYGWIWLMEVGVVNSCLSESPFSQDLVTVLVGLFFPLHDLGSQSNLKVSTEIIPIVWTNHSDVK